MPKVTVSLRTEFGTWVDPEKLDRVEVELVGAGPAATTNKLGDAVLNTDAVIDSPGSYLLRIRHSSPDQHTEEAAGPGIADPLAQTPPSRIYRQLDVGVELLGGYVSKAFLPSGTTHGKVGHSKAAKETAQKIPINWKPVWMQTPPKPGENPRAGSDIDLIVVHHTGGATIRGALISFLSKSVEENCHYIIDIDGHVAKLTNDLREANHAGCSIWDGRKVVKEYSIGIEIVHKDGTEFQDAQYQSLRSLIGRLRRGYPTIAAHRVVGHSDITTAPRANKKCPDPALHNPRKPKDPGEQFEWARLEDFGLGMAPADREETRDLERYGEIFTVEPPTVLVLDDQDPPGGIGLGHFGNKDWPDFVGNPIEQLQKDLETIGYSVRADPADPLGRYDNYTRQAVAAFQRHFFAGTRAALRPGTLGFADKITATWINQVRL